MTALQDPDAIRHFQSLCDACRHMAIRGCNPSELRLYADGYIHCLCRSQQLNPMAQQRLEDLIGRWIQDPSSSIWPEGHNHGLHRLLS
ncbi:MAG: hypothetical protein F4162_09625 [Synechococcus sp. SB0676_bin_10]|uniref:Uncharacterized protein n=1 Tax=Synechococcus sp. SB0676_bin_10 TaxID=2604869 RepID=A0A6B1F9Y0_9SYNE|nr:hypothetical protein [Synechococcus sp. SB0664_bin_36]MYG39188.1 hypothetical protein [Synechococcus sp. SB0676_bin_10]MYK07619.1 hypothetical protein [Synechococcus sp. SB0670_bin_20]